MHTKKVVIVMSVILAALFISTAVVLSRRSMSPVGEVIEQAQDIAPSDEGKRVEQEMTSRGREVDPSGIPNQQATKSHANKCGSGEVLSGEAWFGDFLRKALILDRANPEDRKCTLPDTTEVDCVTGKITENSLGDICYVSSQNVMVALVPGEYLGPGFKLLHYDIRSGQLTVARREDFHGDKESAWFKFMDAKIPAEAKKDSYHWVAPPRVIEQASGDTVIMTGKDGDAGCGVSATYHYDVSENYIRMAKFCSGCVDYGTDEQVEECTELK